MKPSNIIPFDRLKFISTGELFPDQICNDHWIVYHGTSSSNENRIDLHGFNQVENIANREEIQSVVSIYEQMDWLGENGGGYPILQPFSLEHDYSDLRGKPVYFAESSLRAALYCIKDFAGGECARALRYAIEDLQKYIKTPPIREEHLSYLRRNYRYLIEHEDLYREKTKQVDLVWLENVLNVVEGLYVRCLQPYNDHTHGVVYAVKFTEADVDFLSWHNSMGVKAFSLVSSDRIVAKVHLPKDIPYPALTDEKRIDVVHNRKGLFSLLQMTS